MRHLRFTETYMERYMASCMRQSVIPAGGARQTPAVLVLR